ncbi:hypothetical protein GQ600_14260 [Phytophthora cactorum]|nr:hypothetical protein GQ600_14260 [Phytophthora cactorum]
MYVSIDGYAFNSDTCPVLTWATKSYHHVAIKVTRRDGASSKSTTQRNGVWCATFRHRPGRERSMVNLWRRDYQFDDDEKEMFV